MGRQCLHNRRSHPSIGRWQCGRHDLIGQERDHKRIERLFNPYTGADLGDRYTVIEHIFAWLTDLHNNLLGGNTGRLVNGIASCLLTLLSLTGAILWWPGIKHWRCSTKIKWDARFPRFNWDLHSAIGFWCWVFLFVWGISGIFVCLRSSVLRFIRGIVSAIHLFSSP
ncbi:MAG: hypothetical protein DME36_13805 [Verrucomicrobia bacterium]|nr:MAG: hypothetical protein DME36_13805 [Verrucomicrobiota bacterium]